jgi:predicted dehydrogenase
MSATRLAIVGFGRIGALHADWIRAATGAQVAVVIDPTAARREVAERQGLRTSESLELALSDPSIDAILVSTPTSMHFDDARAALRAGKHVMIEKPMTLDLDQSRRLVEKAEARKLVLSVFHNRRWDLDYLTVKSAIDSGALGRVFNVESRLGQWASCVGPAAREWRPTWRNEAAFGGGGLFDWGSHLLDQLWRLMHPSRPLRVFAQLRGNVWSSDCDDFARVLLDFDNGATGLVEINTTTTRPLPRWHLDGTAGSAFSPFSAENDTEVWASLRQTPADGGASRTLPKAQPGMSPVEIWQRFASACRGEGEPVVSARSVLPTMALLDAARMSSHEGRAVDASDLVEWVL